MATVEAELIIAEPRSELIDPHDDQILGDFSDLRHMMMSLPVAMQTKALAEIKERRDSFRTWLLGQLKEGIHFGYPPGLEPRYDNNGNVVVKGKIIDPKQWRIKPTMYAAGSDFICDIMALIDTYKADIQTWEQLGKPEMVIVRRCRLHSRKNKQLVGEGTGARKVSQNDGVVNNAIKMADKSAKQAAVFNAYGLRDLFVQESEGPQAAGTPGQAANAPEAKPRAERVNADNLKASLARWSALFDDEKSSPKWREYWTSYCYRATGKNFDVMKASQWDTVMYQQLLAKLAADEGGAPPSMPSPEECQATQNDLPF